MELVNFAFLIITHLTIWFFSTFQNTGILGRTEEQKDVVKKYKKEEKQWE